MVVAVLWYPLSVFGSIFVINIRGKLSYHIYAVGTDGYPIFVYGVNPV